MNAVKKVKTGDSVSTGWRDRAEKEEEKCKKENNPRGQEKLKIKKTFWA